MYLEVLHDSEGNILGCYCTDSLPVNSGAPLFTIREGVPEGYEQTRINIDTLTAMEIDGASGQKAALNPETGQPEIVNVDRAEYVMGNYKVDTAYEFTPPPGVLIPEGMKVRRLVRRD
ncbi:MAG: hypothetical protein QY316_00500 [Thermodesulfobacteriota bacterium]|nr:MAG: hypothetical protein QY316_00500 [Thermodesulfobacteriota bacterium]